MNKSSFIYGSIILAFVNFIVRVIGFMYKILLSRLIGPEGIGLFQMVLPVLMVFFTITSAGIPIAVSKIVSKEKSLNNHLAIESTLKLTAALILLISVSLSLILVFFSEFISYSLLNNKDLTDIIILLTPAVVIISISSLMRGYFYGLKKISPAGISQIIEQLIRIIFVIGIVLYLYPVTPKMGALIAVCGISIGELLGLSWLIYQYKISKNKKFGTTLGKIPHLKILGHLFKIAVPITISRLINVCLQFINAVLIPQRLIAAGYSTTSAVSTFGRVMGMSMPLIFLPYIVTSALVINIIPNLSEQETHKRFNIIKSDIKLSIKITLLISIPLAGIYIFFSNPIAMLIYQDSIAGQFIGRLGYSTIFLSLQHILSGILHGLGKQLIATFNYIIGMSVQLITTYYLVANPSFGINGFFIGLILASAIISILDFFSINKVIKIKIDTSNCVIKPVLSACFMLIIIITIYDYLNQITNINLISLLISLTVGGLCYIIILFATRSLSSNVINGLFGPLLRR